MRREYLSGVGMVEFGVEGMIGEGVAGDVIEGGPLNAEAGMAAMAAVGLIEIRVEGGEKLDRVGNAVNGGLLAGLLDDVINEALDVDVLSHTSKLTWVR